MRFLRRRTAADPSSTGPGSPARDDNGEEKKQPDSAAMGPQEQPAPQEPVGEASAGRTEQRGSEAHEANTKAPDLNEPEQQPAQETDRRVALVSEEPAQSAKPVEASSLPKAWSQQTAGAPEMFRLYRCNKEKRRPGDCDIIFPQSVYQRIVNHVSSDTTREHGGLLLGYEIQCPDLDRKTAWIVTSLPASQTLGDLIQLTFTHDTWAEFDRQTDALKALFPTLKRLGWYHSHPGHGIFLSRPDLNFCESFTRETGLALVVDPLNNEGGFFVRGRDAKYRPEHPQGFWESQDQRSESLVTWKNMKLVELERGPAPQPLDVSISTPDVERGQEPTPEQHILDPQKVRRVEPDTSEESTVGGVNTGPHFYRASYAVMFAVVFLAFLLSYLAIEILKAELGTPSMQDLESRIAAQEETLKRQSAQLEAIREALRKLTDGEARPPEGSGTSQQGAGQSDSLGQVEQQKHTPERPRVEPSSQSAHVKKESGVPTGGASKKPDAGKEGTPGEQTTAPQRTAEQPTPGVEGKPPKEKPPGGGASSPNANKAPGGAASNSNNNKPPIF